MATAKLESTAVNLLARRAAGPWVTCDSDDELTMVAMKTSRLSVRTTVPFISVPGPVAVPPSRRPAGTPVLLRSVPPSRGQVASPNPLRPPPRAPAAAPPQPEVANVAEVAKASATVDQTPVWRSKELRAIAARLIGPMIAAVIIGVLVGGYVVLTGAHPRTHRPAVIWPPLIWPPLIWPPLIWPPLISPPFRLIAPVVTPVVTPLAAPAPPPTSQLVNASPDPDPHTTITVEIESTPAGATVFALELGRATLVGTTPIKTTLDPAVAHDLVFTLDGYRTAVQRVDPGADHVALALDPPAAVAELAPPSSTPANHHHHHQTVAVATDEPGTLMISTKPPCEILIDGKDTRLTTPQRSISLPGGNHQLTLVNSQQHIRTTLALRITPHQATKLIRDFMSH